MVLRAFISKHNWRALVHIAHRWSHIALFWQIYLFVYLNLVSITFSCNNVFFQQIANLLWYHHQQHVKTISRYFYPVKHRPLYCCHFLHTKTQTNMLDLWKKERERRKQLFIGFTVSSKSSITFSSSWEVFSCRNGNVLSFSFSLGDKKSIHWWRCLFADTFCIVLMPDSLKEQNQCWM